MNKITVTYTQLSLAHMIDTLICTTIHTAGDPYITYTQTRSRTHPLTPPNQLLAYYIADMRKCNVDQPRNLAKSVTVE